MKLIKNIVRETLLIPTRIVQGAVEAAVTTLKIIEGTEDKKS